MSNSRPLLKLLSDTTSSLLVNDQLPFMEKAIRLFDVGVSPCNVMIDKMTARSTVCNHAESILLSALTLEKSYHSVKTEDTYRTLIFVHQLPEAYFRLGMFLIKNSTSQNKQEFIDYIQNAINIYADKQNFHALVRIAVSCKKQIDSLHAYEPVDMLTDQPGHIKFAGLIAALRECIFQAVEPVLKRENPKLYHQDYFNLSIIIKSIEDLFIQDVNKRATDAAILKKAKHYLSQSMLACHAYVKKAVAMSLEELDELQIDMQRVLDEQKLFLSSLNEYDSELNRWIARRTERAGLQKNSLLAGSQQQQSLVVQDCSENSMNLMPK